MKYIFEACVALLLAVITVKTIDFLSYANLVSNPRSTQNNSDDLTARSSSKNSEGKILFNNNCARCHSITQRIVGPPLEGVGQRVPDRNLLIFWVRNNQNVLQSGDPYFNNLFAEYNKFPMDQFPQLDDKQIGLILDYVEGK
jgi:mono/diheme cytochrome c family protein